MFPCLRYRCPWCWSTWCALMQYDTVLLFFWRLCKCINTDISHWECAQLILQNRRWIVLLKHCWSSQHAVLDKGTGRKRKYFSSSLRLSLRYFSIFWRLCKNLSHTIFFSCYCCCCILILQVLRAIKHSPGLMFLLSFFWSIICAFTAGSFTVLPFFICTWVLQKLNKVQSDSLVSCGSRAAASFGFSRGAA